jgi:hypothetical protein
LQANIWTNAKELNGIAGFDDDGNGRLTISEDGILSITHVPDDNMHGTHVVELQVCCWRNNLGIAGAVWNVKLMPRKFFRAMAREMPALSP